MHSRFRISIGIALVALTLHGLTYTPFFRCEDIEVLPSLWIGKGPLENLIPSANVKNLLHFPKSFIRRQILDAFPQIQAVHFQADFSNHRLRVKVVDRSPFALIISYPHPYLVSKEGIILNRYPEQVDEDLSQMENMPLITGIEKEAVQEKDRLGEGYVKVIEHALVIVDRLFPSQGLKIDLQKGENISIWTEDLIEIKWGRPELLEKKIQVLQILMTELESKRPKITYIDIRYPDYPVVKYGAS